MIRVLRTAFLPFPGSLFLLRFASSWKGDKKGGSLFKHAKAEKEQQKYSKLNFERPHKNQNSYKQQPSKQHQENSNQRKNQIKVSWEWDLPALIDPQFLEPLQASLSSRFTLQEEWNRAKGQKDYYQRGMAVSQLMGAVLPKLMEMKAPVSEQLVHAFMEGFFCSHFILSRPVDHLVDIQIFDFLATHKPTIEAYYGSANLKRQLRFYSFVKSLAVRRAGQPKFRELVSMYYFLYRPLQVGLQQVDFAEEGESELIELFERAIKEHPLNSEDERLLNCICSQVPFFPPGPLLHFLQAHSALLQKAEPSTLRSVLEAAKLQGFQNLRPEQFYPFIMTFSALNRRLPELAREVEQLFGVLLTRLLHGKEFSRNFVLETLVELSKKTELQPGTTASELFAFLRAQLEALALLPEEAARHQAKLLFEVLSVLFDNKLLRRSTFESELRGLQASMERAGRRRGVASGYLWQLLRRGEEGLQVFNASYMLELSPKKQVEYIREVLQLDDVEFTKSLMLILVEAQEKSPLLALKRMLPEQDYKQILTQLNQCLQRHGASSFYQEVFVEVLNRADFSGMAIDLLESVHQLDDRSLEEEALRALLTGCMQQVYRKVGGFKRSLEELLQVLESYINNIQQTELLLAQPQFYYLLSMMITYIRTNGVVSEFKVNIYRMVAFLLETKNPLLTELIENSFRHFTISYEDYERLKFHIYLNTLERNFIRFKLDHLIHNEEDIPRIHDKVTRGVVWVNETQNARLNKLYNHNWLPEHLTSATLVAYFMDDKAVELLKDHQQDVKKMVEESSLKDLNYFIYNFNTNDLVIKSQMFLIVWSTFLSRIQKQDIPSILCLYILDKYSMLEDKLYEPFLLKVLEFYADHLHHFTRSMHSSLFAHIKHRFRRVIRYPPTVHTYVMSFRKHLMEELHYISNTHRLRALLALVQLGYSLNEKEVEESKERLLEYDFAFYILILNQTSHHQTEKLLKQYLKRRAQRGAKDLEEVNSYIKLKYPLLKKSKENERGSIPGSLKEMSDKQTLALNLLHKRYKDLEVIKNIHCVINAHHLISFHPSNKPVMLFLQKFYAIEPTTCHLKVHIYDLADLNSPAEFYAELETQGIVGDKHEPEAERNEESPEQKLALAVGKIRQAEQSMKQEQIQKQRQESEVKEDK